MARRVAHPGCGGSLKRLALVLAMVTGLAGNAVAQQPAPSATPGAAEPKQEEQLPPVTRECQVGTTEVVTQTPLPNVTYGIGGMTIKAGGKAIGGLGVSGAPGGQFDEECGNAALAKIADRMK